MLDFSSFFSFLFIYFEIRVLDILEHSVHTNNGNLEILYIPIFISNNGNKRREYLLFKSFSCSAQSMKIKSTATTELPFPPNFTVIKTHVTDSEDDRRAAEQRLRSLLIGQLGSIRTRLCFHGHSNRLERDSKFSHLQGRSTRNQKGRSES